MSRIRLVAFGFFVMLVGSACGASAAAGATPTPEPTEVPMIPVSINEGLASLDSYRLTYTNDILDSVSQQRSVSTFVVASDRNADSSYSRNETRITTEADELISEDVQEQYMIGNQMCQVAADGAEVTALSATAQVMSDLMSQVVDFNPLIENPVYVGEDVVNGVPVRTYTFELRSVGAASEIEVDRADGSYAVAEDGDYVVHYRLDLELRTGAEGDPEAEYTDSSFELSLEEINQPVEIAFPPSCQGAESVGE